MTQNQDTSFSAEFLYGDYLHLDQLLNAQHPRTTSHDELLFIIQHQTSELWIRLVIFELAAARVAIANNELPFAFKALARISRIFEQLNSAWDVLRTMTPSEYTSFRDQLGHSSGFQSYQYRMVEFMLGNRNRAMIEPHAGNPELVSMLEAELDTLSLYDQVIALARRQGHQLPEPKARDTACTTNETIVAFWKTVYENTDKHWELYELGEKLVDLEDYFRRWRFNHLTTVERIIGMKSGTGGTSGTHYLKRMLETELFPDLWRVRTHL